MSGSEWALAVSVFLACAVEAVEALTIVLAVGTTRSWRSALYGVGAALAALAIVVAALGPAVGSIPIGGLRVVVGGLLLVFGLQWLRKAVLRAAGLKELHDEDAIYAEKLREAGGAAAGRVVGIAGVVLHAPLSRVPENLMNLGVGLMLTTFGTFWAAEGAGAE